MQPQALKNPLVGGHLIEASAGTGKTWTLTGILLRLLIERNIKPERVIATTFTKKAAAEMQERMRQRLVDFYDACVWCKQHQLTLTKQTPKERERSVQEAGGVLSDPINAHLILWLLSEPPNKLDISLHCVQALLSSLHTLYIGTLDSFAHKLLKEHSATLGDIHQKDIADNQQMTLAIKRLVQERLRYNHAWLKEEPFYGIINQKMLGDVATMTKNINNAIQFFGVVIDPVALPTTDELERVISDIAQDDYKEIARYGDRAYCDKEGVRKNAFIYKRMSLLPTLAYAFKNRQWHTVNAYHEEAMKLLHVLDEASLVKQFKKDYQREAQKLLALLGDKPKKLITAYALCDHIKEQFEAWLLYDVATYVRSRLSQTLDEDDTTLYSLKMHELLKALQGRHGERLARTIYHQYPIALIDEVQDINGEQASLIKLLYLKPAHLPHLKDKGFLLLVGDPKQAIYRFRGGDVANYNELRAHMNALGLATDATLTVNRRSTKALIDGLNAWFDGDYGRMGDHISYQPIEAVKEGAGLCGEEAIVGRYPISLLSVETKGYEELSLHTAGLLQSGATIEDGDQRRAITPKDIAVLVNDNTDIGIITSALKRYGIDSTSTQTLSVFNGRAANDLYHLLLAISSPTEPNKLGALTSVFFYSLAEAQAILDDQQRHSTLMRYLTRLNQRWQKYGVLACLSQGLSEKLTLLDDVRLWQYWAGFDGGERYLADMWQLYEIVGTWRMPQPLLLEHFIQQINQPCERYARISLPSSQAVSVMTTHKSKGLEFEVVYAFDIDKSVGKSTGLLPYVCQNSGERRLAALGKEDIAKQEAMAENLRLGYVALTRAAQHLFVLVKSEAKKTDSVMREWGFFDGSEQNTLAIPDRLSQHLDMVTPPKTVLAVTGLAQNNDTTTIDEWNSVLPSCEFLLAHSTSFSGIQQLLTHTVVDGVMSNAMPENEVLIDMTPEQDIRQRFMRGREAGTFLHKVLQYADGNNTHAVVGQYAKDMGLSLGDAVLMEVGEWMDQVGRAPLLASGVAIYELQDKITELPFTLGTPNGFLLEELFAVLDRFDIHLTAPPQSGVFEYLVGEIDLVYCHEGKYHLVDYKSNTLNHYDDQAMSEAMDEHHYWLQALIYQVALHRLLAMKFSDYRGQESNYLGAVEYVFLRGVAGERGGRFVCHIPLELVFAVDELLDVS